MPRNAPQGKQDRQVRTGEAEKSGQGSEAVVGEGAAGMASEEDGDMAVLQYAGIGARATPAAVLANMTVMAGWLARTGWHLTSGGAAGADSAFAAGAPAEQRTVWLPWRGYREHGGPGCRVLSAAGLSACMEIAAPLHPAWERCSPAVRKLHARNVAILLGEGRDRPVDAVVCWSAGGRAEGGTGMAIRIAQSRGIPVFDLGAMAPRAVCERLRDIRRAGGFRE